MAKRTEYVRYTIRVPEPLYKRIQAAAGEKSVNAEIVERLYSSFQSKNPGITIQVEALPQSEPTVRVSLLQFLNSFSQTLRSNVDLAKALEREERRMARSSIADTGPTLEPVEDQEGTRPEDLNTSNDD